MTLKQSKHGFTDLLTHVAESHFGLFLVLHNIEEWDEGVLQARVKELKWGVSRIADVHKLKLGTERLFQIQVSVTLDYGDRGEVGVNDFRFYQDFLASRRDVDGGKSGFRGKNS